MGKPINIDFIARFVNAGNADGQGFAYTVDVFPDKSVQKFVAVSVKDADIINSTHNAVYTNLKYNISIRYRINDWKQSLTGTTAVVNYFNDYLSKHIGGYRCEGFKFVYENFNGYMMGIDMVVETH